jgi:hypothetical protein
MPAIIYRLRLRLIIASLYYRQDKEYIEDRVNYYSKQFSIDNQDSSKWWKKQIGDFKLKDCKVSTVYFYDTWEYLRYFDKRYRFNYVFGDVTHIPSQPSFVKSRPITDDNMNSVVLKLNKIRHFIFVHDRLGYRDKKDCAIFRGSLTGKPKRISFFEQYFNHPLCDLGTHSRGNALPDEWKKKKISIYEQLKYKFVFALEGNDVASNLKWIMSSNSVAVMPEPTYETWFMEGRLIPNYHYIKIERDFSDLEDRLKYYIQNPDKAEEIIRNANEYVKQMLDEKREHLISLLVLDRYFRLSGQLDG